MRRYDEWALRVSLGAKTWTLRRQLLIENIVPSIAGAALGVLLALGGVDLLASYIARYSTRASEITVDTTVLGVALVVAFAAASFFAFLPRSRNGFRASAGFPPDRRPESPAPQRFLMSRRSGQLQASRRRDSAQALKNLQQEDGVSLSKKCWP
jgi:hypothetical protein